MTCLVCTQMRVCQVEGSLPYLTSSSETQVFTSGCHKKQPYRSHPRVKSFVQWMDTLEESVVLRNTAVGGHYCFPPAPQVFTQTAAHGSTLVPLVAVTVLRMELETMQYREHKRLAIQGQVVAVQYLQWPQEALSDQEQQTEVSVGVIAGPGDRVPGGAGWSWESSSWPAQRREVSQHLRWGGAFPESQSKRFSFEDQARLLQQSNLQPAQWVPEDLPETACQAVCGGHYKLTILGVNQTLALDAAFVPVSSSEDPRAVGLPQVAHDNSLLSCLSAGFLCPLSASLGPGGAPPGPGDILGTEEVKDAQLVFILDCCHLGGEKMEVIISKIYKKN